MRLTSTFKYSSNYITTTLATYLNKYKLDILHVVQVVVITMICHICYMN